MTHLEFRYGSKKSAVYNPAAKHCQIFKGQQREHIVNEVTDLMRGWKQSPFEREATCRHSIRQGMCMDGHRWSRADLEADAIMQEALRNIGAKRPTWEEGQRGYVEPRENCAGCGDPIRPEDYGVRGRFCSPECAKRAIEKMEFENGYYNSSIGRSAYDLVLRSRKPSRQCKACGKDFKPTHGSDGLFCSHRCYHEHERIPTKEGQCAWCSKPFKATRSDARYCSRACTEVERQVRTGKWVPQRVSPPVFDYFVTKAVNSAPKWISPERFDDLVAG